MTSPNSVPLPRANSIEEDDMALKILHTADWHLGLRFPAFRREDESRLTRARLDVVDRIFGEAESHGVDAILVAGDLFDTPDPQSEWWEGLLDKIQAANWQQRQLLLLPGNHDPLSTASVYHLDHPFRRGLPEGVRVIDEENMRISLGPDAVLYASPCCSRAGSNDLASALPTREPGETRIRIGMVHGQTFDIEGHQTNFPISPRAAEERGFDYLAIGDTHSYQEITSDPVYTVYPGAPEPTRFSDQDAGHVVLACFRRSGRKPILRKIKVGRWRWLSHTCHSMEEVRQIQQWDQLSTTVLRLILQMTVSIAEMDELEKLLRQFEGSLAAHGRVGVMQVDREDLQQRLPSADEFPNDLPPAMHHVIKRLQESDQDPATGQRALYHLFRLLKDRG